MNYAEAEHTQDLSLEETVAELQEVRRKQKALSELEYILSKSVIEGMEERGATRLRTDDFVVRLTRKLSGWRYEVLAKLREITDPADLEGAYTPASEEMKLVKTAEKWNMVKGSTLQKLGTEHRDIIDEARVLGNPKIEIYEKADDIGRQQ